MTKKDTIDYILKNIPRKELWWKFGAKCSAKGKTRREVILELIRKYLKDS